MQIIDNINHIVKNDLQESIRTGSKLSIAAACFSIYAYQELKKQLESIDELRFIFTSPTFVTEKTPKAQREFYIPRISRERSLYGTEFEVKLRNELTQKAVAKECADWIRRKAIFKSNVTQEQMMGFMTVDESTYMPINGFTTVDLGCERGNNAYYPVQKTESYENANYFLKLFEQLWNDKNRLQEVTDVVIENINKTLSWQFTRAELLDAINKLDENRLWTLLLGDDCVETLCSSFSEIRNYRNDVMHAHNIDYEQFNKTHKLFKKVNTELDSAIGKLIGAKETNTEVTSTDFNNTLSSALAALHSPIDTSGLLVVSEALKSITSNQPIISPEVSKTLSQIGRFATGECTLKPEVIAAIANLGKIAALQSEIAPATRAMSEIAKQLASYKIDIPPAVTELQQRLSEIDFSMLPNSNNTQQEDEEKNPNEPHEI